MAYYIDRSKCLCCHNCAEECPVGAIVYQGTGYSVDADRCISCGHCAAVCNVGAAAQEGTSTPPTPHPPQNLQADIVVLGAGAAGIVAAARAAQLSGGTVIVLEKASRFGGSGWFAGFSAPVDPGTSVMPPMFQAVQQRLEAGGIDPQIIQAARQTPWRFFQWFRSIDPRVDEYWTAVTGPDGVGRYELREKRTLFNLKCRDKAIGPGRSTSVMERILVDHFDQWSVRLLVNHRAVAVQRDGTGAVCGVLARDPGGEVRIACRAVISCLGGFVHNEALMRQYAPQFFGQAGDEPTHCFAAPTNTGDVVAIGAEAGAYLDRDNFFANVFGPVHHPFSYSLFCFANQGEMVTVNRDGVRFMDESQFGAGAPKIVRQPGRIAWSIFDEDTRRLLGARLTSGPDGDWLADYERDIQEELAMDTPLKRADTLDALARACGIEPTALEQTIAAYNAGCDAGIDPAFGKQPSAMRKVIRPPFYAIYGKTATDGAFGGMLVNGRMEVYNVERNGIIPGLYAAGDNASGWALRPSEEETLRLMVCNECNWAISSGFVAAESAANYLLRHAK